MLTVFSKIDLSKRPLLYRTSNPKYYGRICIDFQPETVPTVASFDTCAEASRWLESTFGRKQFQTWFPGGIREISEN